MTQGSSSATYIYEGFWINWTKGYWKGLTLTPSPTNTILLTNTLALFITICGGQFWTIVRFTIHQLSSSSSKAKSLSILQNQQQVILRNTSTAVDTARLTACWTWSSRKNATASKPLVVIVLATVSAVSFTLAAAFSNRMADAGSTVLSHNPVCGPWNQTYLDIVDRGLNSFNVKTLKLSQEYTNKVEQDVQLSLDYAQQCYISDNSSASSLSCDTSQTNFQKLKLGFNTSYGATCPFSYGTCSGSAEVIAFDTGVMDSHDDFGINAEQVDRLKYRRVTTCAVLNNTEHTTDWLSGSNSTSSQEIAYAYYGPNLLQETNWTYSYSSPVDLQNKFSATSLNPYQLYIAVAWGPSSSHDASTFAPIPEIRQNASDLMLVFLSYTGRYMQPVEDPWFSAHQMLHTNSKATFAREVYQFDKPISPLACTEQHQFCTPKGQCTDLLGFGQVQDDITARFELTPKQNVTLDRLLRMVVASSLWSVVQSIERTSEALLATALSSTETTTLTPSLPKDQWQIELAYWHAIAMAHLQRIMVEYNDGNIALKSVYLVPPQTASEKWLCQSMMMQSTTYQSFSVIALSIIILFGMIFITVGLMVETSVGWVQRRLGRGAYGHEMWEDHHMLGPQVWREEIMNEKLTDEERADSEEKSCRSDLHQGSSASPRWLAFRNISKEITKELWSESAISLSSAETNRPSRSLGCTVGVSHSGKLRCERERCAISQNTVGRKASHNNLSGRQRPRGSLRQHSEQLPSAAIHHDFPPEPNRPPRYRIFPPLGSEKLPKV